MFLPFPILLVLLHRFISFTYGLNDEGLALLSFKQSIEDSGNSLLTNWNISDPNPCSWHGITCNDQKVVSLSLPSKRLSGILHPALGNLPSLRRLNLRNNEFHGSLPIELFNVKGLQSLVLSGNSFSGSVPIEIGKLSYLQILDLSSNSFNGWIPLSLTQCKRLKTLVLSRNRFTGNLPDGFGAYLISLQKLDLSFNSLRGSIPEDIGKLSNLEGPLDFSHNLFTGTIPENLGNLPETVYIDFSYNNLQGPIPRNDVMMNAGPTAFQGNPLLCGLPLNVSCFSRNYHPTYPQSLVDTSQNSRKHHHSRLCTIITAIGGTITGVALLLFLFSYYFRKASGCRRGENGQICRLEEKLKIKRDLFCFKKRDMEAENLPENMEQYSFVALDSEVSFDLDQLLKSSAYLLGKSGIGIVYRVVLENGQSLAVRRLEDSGWQRFKEFQAEVEAIGKIRHPNVLILRAYCWSPEEKLLIYDYVPNGDLASAIHGKAGAMKFKHLSRPVRLRIMKGIAKGLAYLHEFSPRRYVHGDLNPSNILLGENMEPKVSGFGLGRLVDTSQEFHSGRMTIRTLSQSQISPFACSSPVVSRKSLYQSPEASKLSKPSQKWDVYSYGVMLLEMMTGKLPVLQTSSSETDLVQWIRVSWEEKKEIASVIDPVLVRDMDIEDDMVEVIRIALECVCKNAERRPSMRSVVESLEKLDSSIRN